MKLVARILARIPDIVGNSASFASLFIASGTSFATASTWPIFAFVVASCGIASYDQLLGWSGKTVEEIKQRLIDLLRSSNELNSVLKKHNAGAFLASDQIAALQGLDVSDLPLNAPVRPYLILYRFLNDKYDDIEGFVRDLRVTFANDYELLRNSQNLIHDRLEHLHIWLGCGVDELSDQLEDIEELIAMLHDNGKDISSDLLTLSKKTQNLTAAIDEIRQTPKLDLTIHAYDPSQRNLARFHYQWERTELFGREYELSLLHQFLEPSADHIDIAWWLWIGPGGSGKSRLAQEFCLQARLKGYRAGFLRQNLEEVNFDTWKVRQPTLLVIDYVANKAKAARKAIADLSRNADNLKAPVRFLMLERHAEQDLDQWWNEFLGGTGDDKHHRQIARYSDHPNPYRLRELSPESLDSIASAIFDEMHVEVEDKKELHEILRRIDPAGRPLFAALVADSVASQQGKLEKATQWDAESVVEYILTTEFEERWKPQGADEQHLNLLALLTLIGGGLEAALMKIDHARLPSEIDSSLYQAMTGFSLQHGNERLSGLEPDMLGELFLLRRIEGGLRTATNRNTTIVATKEIMQLAYCLNAIATTDCCGRAIRDFSDSFPVASTEIQEALSRLDLRDCQGTPSLIGDDLATALFHRGAVAYFARAYELAIADYSAVLEMDDAPGDQKAQAFYNRGVTHGQMGNNELEIADYSAVLEMDDAPVDQKAQAFYNRGVTHGQMGNNELEIADYSAVLEMDDAPVDQKAKALVNRGVTHGQMGNNELEIADYSAVLEMDDAPVDQKAKALVNRGVRHGQMGNNELEIADYSAVLEMDDAPVDQRQRRSSTVASRTDKWVTTS